MKKTLLSFLLMLTVSAVMAQHEAMEILPAQDGELPVTTVSKTPTAADGTFNGLYLQKLAYHHYSGWVVNGNWISNDCYEAELVFPNLPNEYLGGGDYFTVECRGTGEWTTIKDDNGDDRHFTGGHTHVLETDMQFRLVLHGGTKDGWVSNILSVKYPAVNYNVIKYSVLSEPNFIDVGVEVDGVYVEMERQDKGVYDPDRDREHIIYTTQATFDNNSACYHRQWYRQNPYTFDRTPIAGANDYCYTPTKDDVGYELVDVVDGDDVNISFHYEYNHGRCQIPILCYPEYMGVDGFVLNTNYALPDGGKGLVAIDWSSGDDTTFPQNQIVERKPGQYVFATPCTDESGFMMEYGDQYSSGDYHMSMLMVEADGSTWYHLAALFFSEKRPLLAKATQAVPIDVICQNTSGDWIAVTTAEPNAAEPLYLNLGRYYLKSQPTANTLATYYPNTLLWSESTAVKPGATYDEEWNEIVNSYTVDVQTAPAPLSGEGVVKGTISNGSECTVYLKQKGGAIIAAAEPDASGAYRFDQVPYGDFVVLVNHDGCIQEQTIEVALTAGQSQVSGVDYKLEGYTIVATGSPSGILSVRSLDADSSTYRLDGRQGQGRGVNIIRLSNGATRKVNYQ